MGLDMTAYSRAKNAEQDTEIMYWRKHNAMHGLMQEIWESKGRPLPEGFTLREGRTVKNIDFNCVEVELDADDINFIENKIWDRELPETHGFFFGSDSRFDEDDREKDLEFVTKARKALAEGEHVYYNSWW